jgi:hypothetical protein
MRRRLVKPENGEERAARDDHDGMHGVQASELQHAEEQAKDHGAPGAEQILPLLPVPPFPPRNQVASPQLATDTKPHQPRHPACGKRIAVVARSRRVKRSTDREPRGDEVQRSRTAFPASQGGSGLTTANPEATTSSGREPLSQSLRVVAQLVESWSPKPVVAGSSPVRPANFLSK